MHLWVVHACAVMLHKCTSKRALPGPAAVPASAATVGAHTLPDGSAHWGRRGAAPLPQPPLHLGAANPPPGAIPARLRQVTAARAVGLGRAACRAGAVATLLRGCYVAQAGAPGGFRVRRCPGGPAGAAGPPGARSRQCYRPHRHQTVPNSACGSYKSGLLSWC